MSLTAVQSTYVIKLYRKETSTVINNNNNIQKKDIVFCIPLWLMLPIKLQVAGCYFEFRKRLYESYMKALGKISL